MKETDRSRKPEQATGGVVFQLDYSSLSGKASGYVGPFMLSCILNSLCPFLLFSRAVSFSPAEEG